MQDHRVEILLIDGHDKDFDRIHEFLQNAPLGRYRIHRAKSFAEGLARLAAGGIDIVLTDIILPDAEGIPVIQSLCGQAAVAPVVGLAAEDNPALFNQAVRAGAEDVFVKSRITPQSLDRVLRFALERKQKERELLYERQVIRTLFDNFPSAVHFKDASGRITQINPLQAKWLGLSNPAQAIGKTGFDFFASHYARADAEREKQVVETGVPLIVLEEEQEWPDGRKASVATSKVPLFGPGKEIIGTFGITRDLTRQKRVEADLRESESRLTAIIKSLDDVVLELDGEGKCLNVWTARENLLAVPKHKAIGRSAMALFDQQTWSSIIKTLQRVLATGKPKAIEYPVEIRGVPHWFVARINPVQSDNNKPQSVVVLTRDVSEKRRVEESLRFLASIVQASEDAIIGEGVDGAIISWNRGAEELFGYKAEEIIRRRHSVLMPPERAEEFQHFCTVVSEGRTIARYETARVRKDGSLVDVSMSLSPIRDPQGEVVGCAVVARDITEQKRAAAALEENSRLTALRAEIGAALTGTADLDAALIKCTGAIVEHAHVAWAGIWLGNGRDEPLLPVALSFVGGNQQLTPGGQNELFALQAIASQSGPCIFQDVAKAAGDRRVPASWLEGFTSFAGFPLVLQDRVQGVLCVASGSILPQPLLQTLEAVVSQVAQFLYASRAKEALSQSEKRARLLFKTIPLPIWVYSQQSLELLEVNQAAVECYGYSRDEFLRMKVTDIHLESQAITPDQTGRHPRRANSSSTLQKHRTKQGKAIDVEISAHQLQFAGRNAVLMVAQDVTERKRMELELRHSQKLEAVGGLAAGIAHEINTPIQFVGDNARFLKDSFQNLQLLVEKYRHLTQSLQGGTCSPEMLREIDQAEQAADLEYLLREIPKALNQSEEGIARVATIVRAMKEFAHPDRSEKTFANLNKALQSTLVVARNEIKYVARVETCFGDLPLVSCHLGDINQVFLNLLVNAAHAIGEVVKGTQQKGLIRIVTRRDGDTVEISISDTGTGIPEAIREKIFEPFFTTKEVGKGTGQGLAIARSIVVEKHGGTLSFESQVGQGATFIVRLPLEVKAEEMPQDETHPVCGR